MIVDEQWPAARLIPISSASGVEAQERRAVSALLAVMGAVPEFGRALLKPLGAPAGRIESFIEVPFKVDGKSLRPDGIVAVTRAGKTWGVLIEAKTGANQVSRDQMELYLDLARELDMQAVLSISNQYVTSSAEYPVDVDRRKTKKVVLRHLSWVGVLTEAVVQKEYRGVSDPDQAYMLGELIRYLSDPRSGAVSFEGMGPSWTTVRDGIRAGTLRKSDPAVEALAFRWDDLVRYLVLSLTMELGRSIRPVLAPTERTPAARRQKLTDSLANVGVLHAELSVPDTAGTLVLQADLRARQVLASTQLDAPREGGSKKRVSWLLRQLQKAPGNVRVESLLARHADSLATTLDAARLDPTLLYPDSGKEISKFRITLSHNMGQKKDNTKGSFAESVMTATETFYREVLQNLHSWKATPPKLSTPSTVQEQVEERVVQLPDSAEHAVDKEQVVRDMGLEGETSDEDSPS